MVKFFSRSSFREFSFTQDFESFAASNALLAAKTKLRRTFFAIPQEFGTDFWKEKKKAIQLDRIVVVDRECTCWEGNPPANQRNDIIEIGVCLLDVETSERKEKRSLLGRRSVSSALN